jgi:ureidoglycolate hydrolase
LKKSNGIFSGIDFISEEKFKKYGTVLELPADGKMKARGENQFKILVTQQQVGWRLAYLTVRNRTLKRLENHPYSMESFEPVRGVSLITVAPHESPDAVETFVLDKPVVLNAGVWHDVLALSDEAEIKITENADIVTEYYNLKSEVIPQLIFHS